MRCSSGDSWGRAKPLARIVCHRGIEADFGPLKNNLRSDRTHFSAHPKDIALGDKTRHNFWRHVPECRYPPLVRFIHCACFFLWGCHSHRERPKPLEHTGVHETEQWVSDAEASNQQTPNDNSEALRLWAELRNTGARSVGAALRALPDPPTTPMFHSYPGLAEGSDLSSKIEVRELRQSVVTLDAHALEHGCLRTPYAALVMPLRLTNIGTAPISFTFHHEWCGGTWSATDLYACTREHNDSTVPAGGKWFCQQLYQLRERYEMPKVDILGPGATLKFDTRMDWHGTPSIRGDSLIPIGKAATYEVQVVVAYRQREHWYFSVGPSTLVHVQ